MKRFFVGVVLGGIGAMITHHFTQSVELAVLVGAGITLVIWLRWIDLLGDAVGAAVSALLRGGL